MVDSPSFVNNGDRLWDDKRPDSVTRALHLSMFLTPGLLLVVFVLVLLLIPLPNTTASAMSYKEKLIAAYKTMFDDNHYRLIIMITAIIQMAFLLAMSAVLLYEYILITKCDLLELSCPNGDALEGQKARYNLIMLVPPIYRGRSMIALGILIGVVIFGVIVLAMGMITRYKSFKAWVTLFFFVTFMALSLTAMIMRYFNRHVYDETFRIYRKNYDVIIPFVKKLQTAYKESRFIPIPYGKLIDRIIARMTEFSSLSSSKEAIEYFKTAPAHRILEYISFKEDKDLILDWQMFIRRNVYGATACTTELTNNLVNPTVNDLANRSTDALSIYRERHIEGHDGCNVIDSTGSVGQFFGSEYRVQDIFTFMSAVNNLNWGSMNSSQALRERWWKVLPLVIVPLILVGFVVTYPVFKNDFMIFVTFAVLIIFSSLATLLNLMSRS